MKIENIFTNHKELLTKRLIIKPSDADDSDIFTMLLTNEKVTENFLSDYNPNREKLESDFEMLQKKTKNKKYWSYTIFLSDKKIGQISVQNFNSIASRVDVGYSLLPEYWRKGIMKEALSELIRELFEVYEINKICASTSSNNPGSCNLLESLNFKLEGYLVDHQYSKKKKGYINEARYRLFRDEFLQNVRSK